MVSAFPLFAGLQGGDYHVFPDGRVLMSGAHTLNDPVRGFVGLYNLIWFTNTGYLDTTRVHRTSNGVIYNFKEQPDGRFLCSGTMTTYDGQPVGKVFRIDAAGALDPTFNAPLPWGQAYAYHTLADGRIMLGGYFKPEGTTDTLCTLRLMPDGTVDPSFHPVRGAATFATGSPVPYVLDIEPLADGRCVIVGRFDQLEGEVRGGIALLDEHGDLLEDAFTGEGCGLYIYQSPSIDIPYKAITGITPAPDGSYYIHGGYHGYDDGSTNDPQQRMVSRLHGLDVGVREVAATGASMLLYPNPTNGPVTVQCDLQAVPGNAHLAVRDALGRELTRLPVPTRQGQLVLDTRSMAPGAYTVELVNASSTVITQKLIVRP